MWRRWRIENRVNKPASAGSGVLAVDVGYHGRPMRNSLDSRRYEPYAVLFVLVSFLGCGVHEIVPTEERTLDLVVEKSLVAEGRTLRAAEVLANDETWVAVTLPPRLRVGSALDLGGDPILRLRGTLQREKGFEGDLSGVLRGGIETDNGLRSEFEVDLVGADGWWLHEVELGSGEGRAKLWFEADLPEGCSLLLREATVRHRVAAPQATSSTPRQILLISVDTLRSDAVGAMGGTISTPHLDRFAAEGERWPRHYAAASWTKPSHASMLTGFHPETHRAIGLEQAMDPAIPTLAERFGAGGFETAALVFDCTWLSPRWGFGKGFDSYRVTRWRAGRQARMAAEWVLDHRDEDFFLFLHTFEPHSDFKLLPYEAPGLTRRKIGELFGVFGFGCRSGRCASQFVKGLHRGDVAVEPRDAEILRYSYDEGVRYLDRSLGGLFDSLRSSGAWDQMLVVVTSDHGEAFGERGEFGHGSLHEEIVRVPLIIKWPGGENAGTSRRVLRSSVDLAPTLLAFAGLDAHGLPGTDLRRPRSQAAVFAGTLAKAVITGDDKGIFAGAGAVRFFDLGTDPGERNDIAGVEPARVAALRELLREHRRQSQVLRRSFGSQTDAGEVVLSERERERLRAFGYLE
jgi:arylsulfatase A-like enzyme